jgi:hypothetical protein
MRNTAEDIQLLMGLTAPYRKSLKSILAFRTRFLLSYRLSPVLAELLSMLSRHAYNRFIPKEA